MLDTLLPAVSALMPTPANLSTITPTAPGAFHTFPRKADPQIRAGPPGPAKTNQS